MSKVLTCGARLIVPRLQRHSSLTPVDPYKIEHTDMTSLAEDIRNNCQTSTGLADEMLAEKEKSRYLEVPPSFQFRRVNDSQQPICTALYKTQCITYCAQRDVLIRTPTPAGTE